MFQWWKERDMSSAHANATVHDVSQAPAEHPPASHPPTEDAYLAAGLPGCSSSLVPLSLDRDEAEQVADVFKVLGDPTRVLILQALVTGGELCVHELAEAVSMSQSSVSHHRRLLRTYGLIRARRAGREVYYRPDDDHVAQLIGVCAEHITHARGTAPAPRGTTSR
jgi:DNA-binding transcriptional ArsR family regulator